MNSKVAIPYKFLDWKITGFNDTFRALQSLKLVSCNITKFPNFTKLSKRLENLDQSNNSIYGQVLEWMFEMGENLVYLNLSYNFLSSIERHPWKNLRLLDLQANLLQGKLLVPPFSTKVFSISHNKLTKGIPSMICNVSSLAIFDISHNNLGGALPQCLGNFSCSLLVMDLQMSNFHSIIPDTFSWVYSLTTLVLNGNQFEELLPKSLVRCTSLEVLDLGNNRINDSFSSWLEALSNLRILVLGSNRLHGPIGNHKTDGMFFSKLQILDLSHNKFIGLLPRNYFENMKGMRSIDEDKPEQQYLGEYYHHEYPTATYYQDSVVVTVKDWR